jgi:hypothetical protein
MSPPRSIEFNGFVPLGSFTYFLTLYSECFSTFPHGTCSLSVSWWYLALEGVYLPLSAALSSNTTPWYARLLPDRAVLRACHPLWERGHIQVELELFTPRAADDGTHQYTESDRRAHSRHPYVLSFSRFARSYSGNPGWFLFLPLLICLNLGGSHTLFEAHVLPLLGACFFGRCHTTRSVCVHDGLASR